MYELPIRLPGQGLRIADATLVTRASRITERPHIVIPDPPELPLPDKTVVESVRGQTTVDQTPELAVLARS
jgi:hypothetical protein